MFFGEPPAEPMRLYPRSTTRRLADALRPLFWRQSRADVAGELDLPQQGNLLTRLRFQPIEKHWYGIQHAKCKASSDMPKRLTAAAQQAQQALLESPDRRQQHPSGDAAGPSNDDWLTTEEARRVMHPLVKLRQACDHPQVGSSGITGGLSIGSTVLTMGEIHLKLEEVARVEAEEAQRRLAMDMNALAGERDRTDRTDGLYPSAPLRCSLVSAAALQLRVKLRWKFSSLSEPWCPRLRAV